MFKKIKQADQSPKILIVEDDIDQLNLLVQLTLNEINSLIIDEQTNEQKKKALQEIKIVKALSIESLKKTASKYKTVLFSIVDCNLPDTDKGIPNDQLVKTQHRITGQHNSVDIVMEQLPNTPITMISSLDRFRRLINKYYQDKHKLNINFISKSDQATIRRNIEYNLKRYLRAVQ